VLWRSVGCGRGVRVGGVELWRCCVECGGHVNCEGGLNLHLKAGADGGPGDVDVVVVEVGVVDRGAVCLWCGRCSCWTAGVVILVMCYGL